MQSYLTPNVKICKILNLTTNLIVEVHLRPLADLMTWPPQLLAPTVLTDKAPLWWSTTSQTQIWLLAPSHSTYQAPLLLRLDAFGWCYSCHWYLYFFLFLFIICLLLLIFNSLFALTEHCSLSQINSSPGSCIIKNIRLYFFTVVIVVIDIIIVFVSVDFLSFVTDFQFSFC